MGAISGLGSVIGATSALGGSIGAPAAPSPISSLGSGILGSAMNSAVPNAGGLITGKSSLMDFAGANLTSPNPYEGQQPYTAQPATQLPRTDMSAGRFNDALLKALMQNYNYASAYETIPNTIAKFS